MKDVTGDGKEEDMRNEGKVEDEAKEEDKEEDDEEEGEGEVGRPWNRGRSVSKGLYKRSKRFSQ